MKKKILYLVTKDDVGGAQKYVTDLAENLDKSKFQIKILAGGKKGIRFLSNAFLPHLLFANDLLALTELFFVLKKERPDILHLNSSKAGVIGAIAAKLAGVPKVVFTAHGWVFNPDSNIGALRKRLYILLHKIAARFQDVIINVSEYDRQLALRHKIAPAEKLITIRNGIDEIKFLDKKTARRALSAFCQARFPDNATWIGSIGRLVAEKSYEDFIEAASLITAPATYFSIIGSGQLKKKLAAKIKEKGLEGRFFIIENLAPAAAYLKALDIFVLSSVKEGLPYTLLEAMAAGLPTVTTRVGGMPEILHPDEKTRRGLVMPPREPEELARAIEFLLANTKEAAQLAAEAQKFLKSELSLAQMVKSTAALY